MLTPDKIFAGSEVRVIAPSRSLGIISNHTTDYALSKLHELGLKITFGKYVKEQDIFNSSSIQSRIDDLHEAFTDNNVKCIITAIGGYNSNQLLPYIDYSLIKQNPKIFCGYSDITALQNAIFHKTGLVTYYGPHFSSFGMKLGFEYCLDYFKKIFFSNDKIVINPSESWSDDAWFLDQENRIFHKNDGHVVLNHGQTSGIIIGGSLSTFQLLHGTEYIPDLTDKILFIEGCAESIDNVATFDRELQSLIHQPNFDKVKALVIGRFENKFNMTLEKLKFIITGKQELKSIPIIANMDFGHTMPMFTFPIGGRCTIDTQNKLTPLILS